MKLRKTDILYFPQGVKIKGKKDPQHEVKVKDAHKIKNAGLWLLPYLLVVLVP